MKNDKNDKKPSVRSGALRRQAEARLARKRATPPQAIPTGDARRLVHELQVHQIELELQNQELQRSRAEVEEALARYTDLYEFAPVGYLGLGREGEIRQINLAGARHLGLDRSRLIGLRLGRLLAAESRPAFEAFLAQVFDHRAQATCEVGVTPEGGAALTCVLTGAAATDGRESRVVVTDITERRRAEQEREALQAQLAQAQKLEAIGTLAGGIAHDFNNILAGIMSGLSLLALELGETSQHRQGLRDMTSLAERGADLARRLLGFARRGKYHVRPLDLARVVEQTSAIFGRTRPEIAIRTEFAPGLRPVLMDHTQLEQLLLNLFINAGQAMPEGGRLLLRAEHADLSDHDAAPHGVAPGQYARLTVADTGVGMDAATRAHIFEPFFTTKEPGQGTGLGLASVYGIVKGHAGVITVASEPGQGTTFTLCLPTTDRPVAEEKAPAPAIRSGTGTILVVDDEPLVAKTCARVLEKLGYSALIASGGRQALDQVRQHGRAISLVILDMSMPDMNGRQTYEALQAIQPGIKVLLSSGYSAEGQAQEILAQGCNGFLEKPYDAATLSAKLHEIL